MAKPTVTKEPLNTIFVYKHKGIEIPICINYRKREITLVKLDIYKGEFYAKEWTFKYRGLEYMKGWGIYEGMG